MKIGGITYPDVNNGTGCRVTLWVSGCTHHCKGCHNPETWNFDNGIIFDDNERKKLFDALKEPYIKGLTLSGGDPLCSYEDVLNLVIDVKKTYPNKDIWLFTGFTKEYIDKNCCEILKYIDFLVDGEYIEQERDLSLAFRGSRNQKIWKRDENGSFDIVGDEYFRK